MLATLFTIRLGIWRFQVDRLVILLFALLIFLRLEYHPCDRIEHLFNIYILLGARFKQWHVHQLSHALSIFCEHHFRARIVIFITN